MKRLWLLFSQAVTVLLAAFFIVATLKPQWVQRGGASSLGERLTAGWRAATRWLSVLWHYELFSVEDSVEVDGSSKM